MIPETYREKFRAAADYGERQWQMVAEACAEAIEDARQEGVKLPKMQLYTTAAADCGVRSSTVRGWCRVLDGARELLPLYQFRFSHWRELVSAAKRDGVELSDLADTYAEESDEWGGQIIPPDVLRSRLNGAKPTGSKYERALHALEGAITALVKHAVTSREKGDAAKMMKAFEETYKEDIDAKRFGILGRGHEKQNTAISSSGLARGT